MTKVEFVNVHNKHFPLGVITYAEEERTKELEELGFELLNKKQEEKPSELWSEKKLKEFVDKHYPEIKYEPKNDTKKELLEKLKEKGYI